MSPAGTTVGEALRADNITIKFGGLVAVDNVSFVIPDQGIVSLIGPNGAGKTTFFNILTGLYQATSGRVQLGGEDVSGLAPHTIAHKGLARTFQNIRLFNLMTAEENVMVAMHSHMKAGIVSTILKTRAQRREEQEARDTARELLDFVGIGKTAEEYARNLSYGDQRRLEVARALALRPRVLLLDEPTAGMGHEDIERISALIKRVAADRTVLMVEHNLSVVSNLSHRITVLTRGRVLAEGDYETVSSNPDVREAYMGTGHA